MIKFTQIADKLKYLPDKRATLSTMHSAIISYVIDHFENTARYKNQVISTLNTISYYVVSGDTLPTDWSKEAPLDNIDLIDTSMCSSKLGKMFLRGSEITWDIEVRELQDQVIQGVSASVQSLDTVNFIEAKCATSQNESESVQAPQTPQEYLSIKPPCISKFDHSQIWAQTFQNNTNYVIYKSLPLIPTNQSEISITTDVSMMTSADLRNLFPNCPMKTRPQILYREYQGLSLDPILGTLFPITGFSPKQVKDNIIRYPHLFKITRDLDGVLVNFHSKIEIDGELHDTLDVWDSLPDSRKIPRNAEFIKEYVIRRYLLERDIKNIVHHYPMFGSLDPFLTLFTTPEGYIELGYKDAVELATKCVAARVSYKRTRSPILKLLGGEK